MPPDREESRARLVALLQLAYSGELAACGAYRGHARSLAPGAERDRIGAIEAEEWRHRAEVGAMLAALGAGPSRVRELRAGLVGASLGLACRVVGRFVPMYGAGKLESRNVGEYERAARHAHDAGHEAFVEPLLGMAEVEWEHERFFREIVAAEPLARWVPLWPAIPPKAAIRASFAHETRAAGGAPQGAGSPHVEVAARALGGASPCPSAADPAAASSPSPRRAEGFYCPPGRSPSPPMRPIRSVSVLMPTWQGIGFLARVLDALARQRIDLPWDFLAIDSGSTDGTWELLGERAASFPVPLSRERILPVEFDHGDTRNLLAARSTGDLLVFLTQDAIPASEDWLATLVRNFEDPRVGAAYCRNLPRPDADLLTRIFSADDPGYAPLRRETRIEDQRAYAALSPHEKRLLWNFNDVASAVRRELWELHPFPRTWFGEDVLMARALLEGGFTVVYDERAAVLHSHDYTPEEVFARAKTDARFNAEWLGRICVASKHEARVLTERLLAQDREALRAHGLADLEYGTALERAAQLRSAAFEGLHEGGLSARRRPATRMLARRELKILYVVHGFPPDTWAGTEIYTFNLALEMQRRGHAVTVLARAPAKQSVAEGGPADFSVEEGEFQGLRVLRMTHRLEHGSLRESYHEPRAEAAFARVLARERPDLVHFQHLIHLSAGIVAVAREHGCATVITCHDYWAICARVQLIRPDGVRCEENMGSGCWLCVTGKGLAQIPRLKRLDAVASPLVGALSGAAPAQRSPGAGGRRAGWRGRVEERWAGFGDLHARHEFVVGAYRAADLRISPSRFLRAKLVETAGFDPHTFVYSDNGMRTDHVRALAKERDPERRVRFGFVGSLVWYKGGEVLLRALAKLGDLPVVLHVHGDFRPESDAHHAELARLAGPNVVFHGRFDNARLSEVYARIDVLVVPSIWFENSPITIHEAFLTRTPVVASDIGGMAEYVRDGVDGLHFRTGDADDLAAKLARFAAEPDLVARLSRDFPPVKSIAEDAAATEFRYRALCCARPEARGPRAPVVLLERRGADTAERLGAVEPQGADMLLVRPGGAAVEYDLEGAGGGRRRIRVEQLALGVEPGLRLGGRVLVDGRPVGVLSEHVPNGSDEVFIRELELDLAPDARRLRLDTGVPGGPSLHLRVRRVQVASVPEHAREAIEGIPA